MEHFLKSLGQLLPPHSWHQEQSDLDAVADHIHYGDDLSNFLPWFVFRSVPAAQRANKLKGMNS